MGEKIKFFSPSSSFFQMEKSKERANLLYPKVDFGFIGVNKTGNVCVLIISIKKVLKDLFNFLQKGFVLGFWGWGLEKLLYCLTRRLDFFFFKQTFSTKNSSTNCLCIPKLHYCKKPWTSLGPSSNWGFET